MHYARCVSLGFLFMMIRASGDLGRRRRRHPPRYIDFSEAEEKSILFVLALGFCLPFCSPSCRIPLRRRTPRADVGLPAKMLIEPNDCHQLISEKKKRRMDCTDMCPCSLEKKQSLRARTHTHTRRFICVYVYLHIKDRPHTR